MAEKEAARMYASELQPVLGMEDAPTRMGELEREMEEVLVETRVRGHPAVQGEWERAVREGREKAASAGEPPGSDAGGEEGIRRRRID